MSFSCSEALQLTHFPNLFPLPSFIYFCQLPSYISSPFFVFPPLCFFYSFLSALAVSLLCAFSLWHTIVLTNTVAWSQKQSTWNVSPAAWWTPIVTAEMSPVACCCCCCCCYLLTDLFFCTWCWIENKISCRVSALLQNEVWALQRLLHLCISM